jgi:hypothetical protein
MSAKRGLLVALAFAVVATAVVLLLGRRTQPAAPAHHATKASVADAERPRRPRAERPRAVVPATREASVQSAPGATAAPAAVLPASARTVSPRAEQLATTVLQAAVRGDWVVVDDHDTPCPPQKVRVVYDTPSDLGGYQKGAYFEPLGPGPGDSDSEVNGLLLCEGSSFLYRGFEAYYRADRGQWDVFPFPVIE